MMGQYVTSADASTERTPTSLKEGWAKIFGFLPPAGYAALRSLFGGTRLWSGGSRHSSPPAST